MENKIIIAGGSGFIGKQLTRYLNKKNYPVVILSRHLYRSEPMLRYFIWDGKNIDNWAKEFEGAKAVINLTGKNINCRFTNQNKREILNSRVTSVNVIAKAIRECKNPPEIWIQASSIGYFGNTAKPCHESSPPGNTFLAEVTKKWEDTFFKTELVFTRKIALRIGIVLGKDGGALLPLKKLTNLFLGGTAGKGNQDISWIHQDDLLAIIDNAIEDKNYSGVFNAVSPCPITNSELMNILRKVMHKPWSPPIPEFAIKLGSKIIGTESSLILDSSQVIPKKLISVKYKFRYSDLMTALQSLL